MRLLCPAKINLHLRVGPLREDGFHSLLSWFCTTGLFDTLTLESAAPSGAVADGATEGSFVSLTCDQPGLPCDRRHLVVRIGEAWAEEARKISDARVFPVRADLRKRIPTGAGLGGGSSDGREDAAWIEHFLERRPGGELSLGVRRPVRQRSALLLFRIEQYLQRPRRDRRACAAAETKVGSSHPPTNQYAYGGGLSEI